MTATYDRAECARLIAEALERSTLITADIPECTCAGWPHHLTCLQEGHLEKLNLAHAWLRNNLAAMADQLEAAGREVERMSLEGEGILAGTRTLIAERDKLRAELAAARKSFVEEVLKHDAVREKFTAELAVMFPVVEAAEAIVPDWRDTSGSFTRIDALNDHCDRIANAVDAYRTKAGR